MIFQWINKFLNQFFLKPPVVSQPNKKQQIVKYVKTYNKTRSNNYTNTTIQLVESNTDPNDIYPELLLKKGNLRDTYKEGECELAAKEFQKVYGGNLVFIAPYKRNEKDGGVWIICDYCGAWVNRIYYKSKILWVDYANKDIFNSKETMRQFSTIKMQLRFSDPIDTKVFVYGEDQMPYSMKWHY